MPRFKHYNYDQDSMVVINYQEQLQPGTFEQAVHYLIEHKLDLSVFHPRYRNDDTGRLAYDPAILLKIILFAYSKGITSSREIQWCCETNIIFKALSCDTVPHFTTLAKFVSQHADEIEELFEQILLVCHEQGLLGNELFAIDSCKMSSDAAKEWSGTFKELGEKRDKLKRLIRHHLHECQRRFKTDPLSAFKCWLIGLGCWLRSVRYRPFSYPSIDSFLPGFGRCARGVTADPIAQRLMSCRHRRHWPIARTGGYW